MTEYIIALQMAIAFLDQADRNEVIYFLDHLNSNYCSHCGEKMPPSKPCTCWLDVWHTPEQDINNTQM